MFSPDKLEEAMLAKGWKPMDLARAAGVSHTYVQQLLKGAVRMPRDPYFDKLTKALDVEREDLLDLPGRAREGEPPGIIRLVPEEDREAFGEFARVISVVTPLERDKLWETLTWWFRGHEVKVTFRRRQQGVNVMPDEGEASDAAVDDVS